MAFIRNNKFGNVHNQNNQKHCGIAVAIFLKSHNDFSYDSLHFLLFLFSLLRNLVLLLVKESRKWLWLGQGKWDHMMDMSGILVLLLLLCLHWKTNFDRTWSVFHWSFQHSRPNELASQPCYHHLWCFKCWVLQNKCNMLPSSYAHVRQVSLLL